MLLVALLVGSTGRAAAQVDGGAPALPQCPQAPLLAASKKVERDGQTCLPSRKRVKKASYVHLDLTLAASGQVDGVTFDGEPLSPDEESCLRQKVAAWKLPKQAQACRYDGFLLQVPVPKPVDCKPTPSPKPDPELQSPFRLGLVMDTDGFFLASPNAVLSPAGWEDLSARLAEVKRAFPDGFAPAALFVVVKRRSTPDAWVDDLMATLREAGVERVAIRVDDAIKAPPEGCFGSDKDVAKWRKLFKSVAAAEFQRLDARVPQTVPSAVRPPIVGADLDTLMGACTVIRHTIPSLRDGLIASHCSQLPSCAGECSAEMMAFAKSGQLAALASCKAFETARSQCGPVHPLSCGHRWVREQLLAAVAATAKGTPPLSPELADECRAARLLP